MLASQLLGTRFVGALVVGSVVVLVAHGLPVPEIEARVEPAPTYHYVPVTSYALQLHREEHGTGSCLPFLVPILEYPNWQIHVDHGISGCTGDTLYGSFEVHHDGSVAWSLRDRPTRTLHLLPDQLERITTIDRLDCVAERTSEFAESWYRIGVGTHDGAHISEGSTMAKALDGVFDERIARYYEDRLAQLGPITVHVDATAASEWSPRTARYVLTIADRRMTIRHGRRVLLDQPVELTDLIDLVDVLASTDQLPPYVRSLRNAGGYETARGTVTAQGITLEFAFGHIEYGVTRFLADALYTASRTLGE